MAEDEVAPELNFPARDVEAAHRRAAEQRRQYLIDSVWNDTMLPSEAEELAAETGLIFDGSDGPVTMETPKWSLAQAVVWIAWREPGHIQEQWWRLHAWSGSLWRDPPREDQKLTFEQAEVDLWAALEAGRVHAIGLPGHTSKPTQIDALDWSNLVWMPDKRRLSVRYFGQQNPAYRVVEVKSADMLAVWPAPGAQAPEAVTNDSAPTKRGRPEGTSFSKADTALAENMNTMVAAGQASSPTAAAWSLIGRDGSGAKGTGTPEAKVKRLVGVAKALREAQKKAD